MMKTVLLVEDEPDVRLGLAIDLEAHGGFTVWEAGDRAEALMVLEKRGCPNVVMTDVMMPSSQQAGLDLISDIRTKPLWKYLPIVVLSSLSSTQDILEALKRGATDYLLKPCVLNDMLNRLERAYELSRELATASPTPTASEEVHRPSNNRKLHSDTLKLSLWYWELTTQKNKIDLAQESQLWTTYLDAKGSYSARTFDKYLNESSLPSKPRTSLVIQTARFVLKHCPEDTTLKPQLEKYIDELSPLVADTGTNP